jgi:CxxC-x17-CxxC domain-containing protein
VTYTDKTLTCRDCGTSFVFTSGEQEFYAGRGFANEPGRCPSCRAARKGQRDGGTGAARSGEGWGGRGTREMFPATCAECGVETEVPFMPRGDRPVYCSRCFDKVRSY